MRNFLLPIAAVAVLCAPAAAQTLTVTGSNVTDSSGNPMVSGTISFAPVDLSHRPLSYRIGGGGQALTRPVTATIINGAFSLKLADVSATSPLHVCFAATVIDAVTQEQVLGPGYSCVQPMANVDWCGPTSCNFDEFNPNTPGLPLMANTGSGSVQSVNLTAPSDLFTVTGGPVTSSGTLALGFEDIPASSVLVGTGTSSAPVVRQLTMDDIAPAFGVSLGGSQTVELGATISNPMLTASYTGTVASATLTNTDNVDSPLTVSTPFTSIPISGSFRHTSNATTTFTLTATNTGGIPKSANASFSWLPLTFYGVGGSGATGATASGSSASLAGASGTLSGWGLGIETGTVSVSPSGQYIYFLLTGASHTFTVNGFGTTFSVTPQVTFTNEFGVSVQMFLYTSPTYYTGPYSVGVN